MQRLDQAALGAIRMLLDRQPTTAAKVTFAWTIAAGPALSRAATVSWSPDGVLRVRPRSEAWRIEMARARPLITQRVEQLLGPGIVRRVAVEGPPVDSPASSHVTRDRS